MKKNIKRLKSVVAQTPDNVFALHYLDTFYIRNRHDYNTGLTYLNRAIEVQQHRELNREEILMAANTYYTIGAAYLNHFLNPSKAIPYHEKALDINPLSPYVLLSLTKAYQQTGRCDEAFNTLQKAAHLIRKKQYTTLYEDLASVSENTCAKTVN